MDYPIRARRSIMAGRSKNSGLKSNTSNWEKALADRYRGNNRRIVTITDASAGP